MSHLNYFPCKELESDLYRSAIVPFIDLIEEQ